jgi:nifR3 family TIM-barrel protein
VNAANIPLLKHIISGSLFIPGNLFLAPLAGFSDRAFRDMCVEHGADCTFTEMVSAEGVVRGNLKTAELMHRGDLEKRYAIQLFTSNPETMYRAAVTALDFAPVLIDINCGCPVPKVTKTGAGSALMKHPRLIGSLVSAVAKAVKTTGTSCSVSVKLRSGWDEQTITFREAAEEAAAAGAALITLHPRTRAQGYSGTAEWDFIGELKQLLLGVPVIGSGDLFSPEDAKRMLLTTGCDGIMFARGAVGNPFIFSRTRELLLKTGELDSGELDSRPASAPSPPPSLRDRLETALRHLDRALHYESEKSAVKEMKKQFCAYTKGLPGGAALRQLIVRAKTADEYKRIIGEYISDIDFTSS